MRQILTNAIGSPCPYCGHPMQHPEQGLRRPSRDHIRPRSKDHTLAAANRAVVCEPCNVAKGSRSLVSFLFRLDRAQDPRAPFVAAFIHELVSEGRHHHLGGLVLTNNRRIDFRAGLEISGRRAAMILKGRCYRP
jgi:hypothetical protein